MLDSAQIMLIGVDGGGTGCRVAVGTQADGVLARAEGGPANFASDPVMTIKNITETITAALEKAGAGPDALTTAVVHVGLAGVMTQEDGARAAAALPFEAAAVTNDCPTAVTGALGGQDGYLLAVGTGTIVATSTAGQFRYVGGWGFHLADQASGAWLGRVALQQALLCVDGVEDHSDLTRRLLARFDNDPARISAFGVSAKPGDYGKFAPDVVKFAKAGDRWGLSILNRGAQYLSGSLTALGFKAGETLCLSGGVGPHYAAYLPPDFLSGRIEAHGNAIDGAFLLAARCAEKRARSADDGC